MIEIVAPSIAAKVQIGSSVSVSGVCLTVAKKNGVKLFFDVMAETLRKTILRDKKTGALVNLETSLRLGDEVGGHFVYGHVDGVGEVTPLLTPALSADEGKEGLGEVLLKIKPPLKLMRYIVPQGSVVIDGVSLTVARADHKTFMVSLVPYTLKHTTLEILKKGDRVNIEVDMISKYVELWVKGNG